MINKTGPATYWAAGMTIDWNAHTGKWSGTIEYFDDGFMDDDPAASRISTEGVLKTRYGVGGDPLKALGVVVRVLIKDAVRLGIRFERPGFDRPFLYLAQQGGSQEDNPLPGGWEAMFAVVASRHDWDTYKVPEEPQEAEPSRLPLSWEMRAHQDREALPRDRERLLLGYLAAVACAPRDFGTPATGVPDWYTAEVPDSSVKVEWYVMPHQILVMRVTDLTADRQPESSGA